MAELHGKAGDVQTGGAGGGTGGTSVSGMKNWSIKYNQTAAEVTNFTDTGVKRFIAGESGWSGSFTGAKTGVPLNITTLGLVWGTFKESATAGQLWYGQMLITDISAKVDAKGVVEYSYTFQGSGPLTIATA